MFDEVVSQRPPHAPERVACAAALPRAASGSARPPRRAVTRGRDGEGGAPLNA
jgi:hypothetical protein